MTMTEEDVPELSGPEQDETEQDPNQVRVEPTEAAWALVDSYKLQGSKWEATTFRVQGNYGDIFGALAKAQGEFQPIHKTKTAEVKGQGFSYKFSFAPLETVLAAVTPALSKNGLALLQPVAMDGNSLILHTMLCHESGAFIESRVRIIPEDSKKIQKIGSALTYMRRYSISAMLGVTSEEDDDGNGQDGNQSNVQERQPQRRRQPPTPNTAKEQPKQEASKKEEKSTTGPKSMTAKTRKALGEACKRHNLMNAAQIEVACKSIMGTAFESLSEDGYKSLLEKLNQADQGELASVMQEVK